MNKDTQEQLVSAPGARAVPTEQELLAQLGFTTEEIASLLWLRQWYQTGGSDRAPSGVPPPAGAQRRT